MVVGGRSALETGFAAESARVRLSQALRPAQTALALGAAIALLVALGYAANDESTLLRPFGFERRVSVPGLLAGTLLLATCGLVALGGRERLFRRPAPEYAWRAVAVAILIVAVDVAGPVHERAAARLELAPETLALPMLVLGSAAWLGGIVLFRGDPRALAGWSAGGLCWSAAGLLEVVGAGGAKVERGGLELVGASLLFLAALVAIRQTLRARGELSDDVGLLDAMTGFVTALDLKRVATAIAAAIAVFSILGALVQLGLQAYAFDLSVEQTVPSAFSGGLLFLAAALAVIAVEITGDRRGRWIWAAMAAALGLLGLDEFVGLHEHLEQGRSKASLLPLMAIYGAAWLAALTRLRSHPSALRLWLLAALALFASQAIEATHEPNPLHVTIVPEEALEMVGGGLFCLALLLFVRESVAARGSR